MALFQQVLQAQAAAESTLLGKNNVIGVAVGYKETEGIVTDELALVALVPHKLPAAQLAQKDLIPRTMDGVRTDVYEVGDLRAQIAPTDRFRPVIPPGSSAGHYRVTAGTLGAVVRDKATGERLLLSNNHVFANNNEGNAGDSILQPGSLDGGAHPADMIARLERFVPLRFIEDSAGDGSGNGNGNGNGGTTPDPTAPGCNPVSFFVVLANIIAALTGSGQKVTVTQTATAASAPAIPGAPTIATGSQAATRAPTPDNAVDAALAKLVNNYQVDDNILGIGRVTGTKIPEIGMTVRKSGRTTGLTQGRITLLNATITISYDTSRGLRTARFTGQVLTESISQGGDSGSLVVDGTENKAVGLLFAGSPVATVFTPIDTVLAALNVLI